MVIDSLFQKRSQNLPIYLQADVPDPPPPPDGKVGIGVTEKFRFSDFHSTSFNSRTILFSLLFTSWQCSSFVMGNVPIGSLYTFTIYSIHVMANLST